MVLKLQASCPVRPVLEWAGVAKFKFRVAGGLDRLNGAQTFSSLFFMGLGFRGRQE